MTDNGILIDQNQPAQKKGNGFIGYFAKKRHYALIVGLTWLGYVNMPNDLNFKTTMAYAFALAILTEAARQTSKFVVRRTIGKDFNQHMDNKITPGLRRMKAIADSRGHTHKADLEAHIRHNLQSSQLITQKDGNHAARLGCLLALASLASNCVAPAVTFVTGVKIVNTTSLPRIH